MPNRNPRSRWRGLPWVGIFALVIAGCSAESPSGPGTISWNRDICQHCMMAIGEPQHAAQIRDAKGELHRFDDIGCAVLWLDAQQDSDVPGGFWVGSRENGWLEAAAAGYIGGQQTPMGYGFRTADSGEAALEFNEMKIQIREREDARRSSGR